MALIFYAEDDEYIFHDVIALLRSEGHEVLHFHNGEALWRRLRDAAHSGGVPDVVVTDNDMPIMTGDRLLHDIEKAGMPVGTVLVSSDPSRVRARCDERVAKFDADHELGAAIRGALRARDERLAAPRLKETTGRGL